MKTKIIGITLAVIMLASIFVAMMPMGTVAQVDPATGRMVGDGGLIVIGERKVGFYEDSVAKTGIISPVTVKGPTDDIGSTGKNTIVITGSAGYIDSAGKNLVSGEYGVYNGTTLKYTVTFTAPTFTLETKKVGTDDKVSSVVKNDNIDFDLTTNLAIIDSTGITNGITYKVTDASGVPRDATVNIDSAGANTYTFSGTDKVGTYTVYAKTNKTTCNGLEATSSTITFTVTELGISINADPEVIAKGEEVTLTGTTSPKADMTITLTSGDAQEVTFLHKGDLTQAYPVGTTSVALKTTSDGTYTVVAEIGDIGTYEFEAKIGTSTSKTTVEVVELSAEITTDKTTYAVGEDIEISGTSNAGTIAIIAFDGEIIAQENIKADKTFSYDLSGTSYNKPPGSYKIELFVYQTTADNLPGIGHDTDEIISATTGGDATADASTVLLFSEPELTAEISTETAALGDDFTVSGTATGTKQVTILVVAPRGTGASGISAGSILGGLSERTPSVSTVGYTFTQKYEVDKSGIDTGKYLVIVVSPGRDGQYTRSSEPALIDANNEIMGTYDLKSKTQSQLLSIILDACDPLLSDDIMFMEYISLETAYVTLDPIQNVGAGEPLMVSGTTNRKDDYPIVITVTGPIELVPESVKVEDGTFNATFDTTGADAGKYTVKADDGDGHTDEADVEIGAAAPTTPTPVATPGPEATAAPTTAAPSPVTTAAPTEAPGEEEPTPTEEPGFEAVFAIGGLLAVAYLVLRIKK